MKDWNIHWDNSVWYDQYIIIYLMIFSLTIDDYWMKNLNDDKRIDKINDEKLK